LDLLDGIDQGKPMRISRYEIMWEREESLPSEIQRPWDFGTDTQDLGDIASKLRRVMTTLKSWSQDKFGAVSSKLDRLRKKLVELQEESTEDNEEVNKVRNRMDKLLYHEEMMWLQRSCITWLKEGDRNTKFFHHRATGHAKKNRIKCLKKQDGQITKDTAQMQNMTTNFFKDLYKAGVGVQPTHITSLLQPMISQEMNGGLCKEFTDEEISSAMFQIGPLKVPVPNGLPALFQRNWEVVKRGVITAVKTFFETGTMPHGVNKIVIVLLPKKDEPEELKDFKPIAVVQRGV
jgi:hypothetical protein